MAKKAAPTYMIASISYWSGDSWSLEPGIYSNRKEAEAKLKELREADFPLDIKVSRKYRVFTMTEVKRRFGSFWYENVRHFAPDGTPLS